MRTMCTVDSLCIRIYGCDTSVCTVPAVSVLEFVGAFVGDLFIADGAGVVAGCFVYRCEGCAADGFTGTL